MARCQQANGPVTINPAKSGKQGWGTEGNTSKKGDSWFTGEKPGATFTQQVTAEPRRARRSTSCARSIPGCRARSRSCRRRLAARRRRRLSSAPPGAPSFPRRPGRRRAALLPAAAGARPAARSARARRSRAAAGAAPFRARLPIPRELSGARIEIPIREAEVQILPGPQDAGCGPTAAPSRGRRSAAPPASAPRSPSTTELPAEAGELTVHLHGGHNRTQFDGQPGGLTKSHPRSFYCQIPHGALAAAVRQRPADRARAPAKPTSTT